MKLWSVNEPDPEFELTPMIDVVFLLIAFFMTWITFINNELIELVLPEAEAATVAEDPGERQYISVTEDGEYYLGAYRADLDTIIAQLRARRQEQPTMKVFLRADAETPHIYVNRLMSACAEAAIFDLIFASEQD